MTRPNGSGRNWCGTAKIGAIGRRALRGGGEGAGRKRQLEQCGRSCEGLRRQEGVSGAVPMLQEASSLEE